MEKELSYQDYVNDQPHMKAYSLYQRKYAKKLRESDKVLITIIDRLVRKISKKGRRLALLDLGCSTGNLLLHLKHSVSGIDLFGGDIVSGVIAECRSNPDLANIHFEEMDMLNLSRDSRYDFVVANAATQFFSDDEFERAIVNIGEITRQGGFCIIFELFNPFEQEVSVIEKSKVFPQGFRIHLRRYSKVKECLTRAGFADPIFQAFNIPIDLPRLDDLSNIRSYTIRTDRGERMCFRGSLFQPWCHVVTEKIS